MACKEEEKTTTQKEEAAVNEYGADKEEVVDVVKAAADRSSSPRPLEALASLGSGPPRFLTKTFDIIDNPSTDAAVSWSRTGNSFVVWDPFAFSTQLLPKIFKHNNFSSFVRQLNTYGFRKVDPDRWEFANEAFLRGQKQLLSNIQRRKSSSACQPLVATAILKVGRYGSGGVESELEGLKQDKNTLMMEVVQLQDRQQEIQQQVQAMSKQMQTTEQRQQKILAFLARLIHNPAFLSHLTEQQQQHRLNPSSSYSPCLTTIKKRRLVPTQDDGKQIRPSSKSSSKKSESPTGNLNPNAITIASPENLPFLEMDLWHSQFKKLLLELNPSKGSTSLELPAPQQATELHLKQDDKSNEGEWGEDEGGEEEEAEGKLTTEAETMLLAITGANGVAEEQLFWEELLAASTSAFNTESTPQCSTMAGYSQALAATTPREEEEEEEEIELWEEKPSVEKLAEKLGHLTSKP